MNVTKSLLLSASLATALTGCASLAPANNPLRGNSPQAQEAKHDTKMAALKGGAIGCGVGAATSLFAGGFNLGNIVKRCAIGAAVGAVAGGVMEYKHQLDDARALQAQANAAGAQATLTTKEVQAKDEQGQVKTTQAFDALTINLDAYKTRHHDQSISDIAHKAASMANASKTPITIEVDGQGIDRAWLLSVMRPQLTHNTTTLREAYSATPKLVLSPVPDVKASGDATASK